MPNINELKEQEVTECPLLLFECRLTSGETERWSTNRVQVEGETYEPRVLRHNLFELRMGSDDGLDAASRVWVTLANADSRFSQIERQQGWKGARLTVRFVFFDLVGGVSASESRVVFRGIANPPDEITESTLRLSFINRLTPQRVFLPEVRIQRRCPWYFPGSAQEREEAVDGGARGSFSPFYRCGYSADVEGGVGNPDGAEAFTACDRGRAQCTARGMFDVDAAGHPTRRFGGIEFVPPGIDVRSHGERGAHSSAAVENVSRYNDFVPLVYGTAWYAPPVVFARNDGNLTRMEVLLGMGAMEGVLKVVVNGAELPAGIAGRDMTATGWYNLVTRGERSGGFNLDFTDSAGRPLGDPYGSMAVLSVVVPNRVSEGRTLPRVEVLAQGVKVPRFGPDGTYLDELFANNPAWVLLDILRRSGWGTDEVDLASFARTAERCNELAEARDLHGNTVQAPRYQCNLVIRKRRSAGEVIRGVRNGACLFLTYGDDGRLTLGFDGALGDQQPVKPEGSNSVETLNGGWPAYEFGDGSSGFSGIVRGESGEPRFRMFSRSSADSTNRLSIEFQDEFNGYQQDSLSLTDVDDVLRSGQEVSGTFAALGLANFSQAARVLGLHLRKAIRGNTFVEFETSVRAIGLKPGDLITLTYVKEGLQRQPFRIVRIAPGTNYRSATITAQIHEDAWYADAGEGGEPEGRRTGGIESGLPRPLGGSYIDEYGEPQFGIEEREVESTDGGARVALSVAFSAPARPSASAAGIPLASLAAGIETTGGSLAGGQTLYYAISGVDAAGAEGGLSFLIPASIPAGTDTNRVSLGGFSFGAGTEGFHVYRGRNPAQLFRIASGQAVSGGFSDDGLAAGQTCPPDENYDHANFYWRLELQPEVAAAIHSADRVGNESLQMAADELRGATVRITRGTGAGQERTVSANSGQVLTVAPAWTVEPDATSYFVVAESGWRFASKAAGGPAEFEAPNREGATLQVSGRAANVHGRECAYELSPLTRWRINGAPGPALDRDVPGEPVFGLYGIGRGTVELQGLAFSDLDNTRTISAATLTVGYWDELNSPTTERLAADIGEEDQSVDFAAATGVQPNDLIQIDSELMVVEEVLNGGLRCRVSRGSHDSATMAHFGQTEVYHLRRKVFVLPFARDFFGSPASGSYSFPFPLPNARIAAASLFATNSRGSSPTARRCYTNTLDCGLRTFSGGQLSIQIEGFLAVQSDAAPPLIVQDTTSVRDVFATVREAPEGGSVELELKHNGIVVWTLSIPAAQVVSTAQNGFGLPPLAAKGELSLDIVSVPTGPGSRPGRDLTVTIRL